MRFFRTVWLVTRKDLLIEVRSKEILFTTLFFALACVLVFAFGFVREGRPVPDAAAGILWIAIAFSGTLALGRAFERERQSETLRALMMAPVERPALYLGKLARRADVAAGGRSGNGSAGQPCCFKRHSSIIPRSCWDC